MVEETRLLTGTTTVAEARAWVERQRAAKSAELGRTLKARIVRMLDVDREMYERSFADKTENREWPLLTDAERTVQDAARRLSNPEREFVAERRTRREVADARDRGMRYGDD